MQQKISTKRLSPIYMEDVERVCAANHERRKWADEYAQKASEVNEEKTRKRRKKRLSPCAITFFLCSVLGACFTGIAISNAYTTSIICGLFYTALTFVLGCTEK